MRTAHLSLKIRCYYRLRRFLPLPIRQLVQRVNNGSKKLDDGWFFTPGLLNGAFTAESSAFDARDIALRDMWPGEASYALVLTHDVETSEGMRLIPQLAELEEELGFRSVWNVVPYKYDVDRGLLRELQQRGFEIGVHGYNHDGRLFWSERIFQQRLPYIQQALKDFNATGFRAPMVHRNLQWLQALNIEYDASCFDVDPYQPMPGGVGSLWPFVAGDFVELPYTLPQDHTLMITLGEQSDNIWRRKLEFIRQRNGMALLITHPDYLNSPQRLNIYRSFLEHVREEGDYWHALPREVAQWTRKSVASAPMTEEHDVA